MQVHVRNEWQLEQAIKRLRAMKMPLTVSAVEGRARSVEQNRLQRLWGNEIAAQLGDRTPEQVRGYNKLHFGVPILRAENEDFAAKYDATVKPLPYETKLELMQEPIDLPVTRNMNVSQATRFLDAVWRHWTEQGLVLTEPEAA